MAVSARRGVDLTGATALVTGGASGIGRALGASLLARGASVVLADLDGDAAERAAGELDARHGGERRASGERLDVRDEGAFRTLVERIIERHGQLDLLFNNAGISLGGRTHEMTSAHWDRLIDVNLRGVVNGVLAAYPHMVERRGGRIVNTASGAGLVGPPFVAGYAVTKHAVVGLSLTLRPEAAMYGVAVNVLCPGAVDTPILDRPPDTDLPPSATPPLTPRQYLRLVGQRPISPERFAERALEGVLRDRAIVVVPRSAGALWYLHRLSPSLTQAAGRTIARRVDRRLERPPPNL